MIYDIICTLTQVMSFLRIRSRIFSQKNLLHNLRLLNDYMTTRCVFCQRIPEIFINRMMWPWLRIEPLFRFLYRKELAKLNRTWRNFTETPIQVNYNYYIIKPK